MTRLDVSLPKSWAELSQEQLYFLLDVIATVNATPLAVDSGDDAAARSSSQVKSLCFLRWSGLKVVCPADGGLVLSCGDDSFFISLQKFISAISHLDWTSRTPSVPVRLDVVDGAEAIPADLSSGLSFDGWLTCETLWQQYQISVLHSPLSAPDLLRRIAEILYGKEGIALDAAQSLGIFYWWCGVKSMVSDMFPNFFHPSGSSDSSELPTWHEVRRNIDAQIRALTRGDVTKEKDILALDAIRALTELDAQAREYDELQKKYPSS